MVSEATPAATEMLNPLLISANCLEHIFSTNKSSSVEILEDLKLSLN